MLENSTSNVVGEFCGTSNVVSSAYLRITLTDEMGLRSFAYMMYRQGPIPDPCTIGDVYFQIWSRDPDHTHFGVYTKNLFFGILGLKGNCVPISVKIGPKLSSQACP